MDSNKTKAELIAEIERLQKLNNSLKVDGSEENLKQREEQFRFLAENSQDMIYRMALPSGNYEYVSPASNQIFGYSPDEFINTPLLIKKAIHPDWTLYFEEQWDLIFKGSMPASYEYQIVHGKSKEIKWLHQRNALIKNQKGEPIAIEGIVTDITEQKKAQEALIKNERRLKDIFKSMSEGFSIQDVICDDEGNPIDLRFVDANPAFEKQTGLKNSETLGHTLLELFPTSERIWIERYGKVGITGEPISFEAMFGPLNIYYSVNAFQTAPRQFGVLFTDINERKLHEIEVTKANEKIEESEKYLKYSQKLAKLGHWKLIPETLELETSEEQLNIFEIEPGQLTLDSLMKVVHPEDRAKIKESIEKGINEGKSWDIEHRLLLKNGKIKWIRAIGEPHLDPNNKVKQIDGIVQDITEQKKAEEAIRENEEKLRLTIDNSPLGVGVSDIQGNFISTNQAYEKMVGYSKEELRKMSIFDVTHPDDHPENRNLFENMFSKQNAGFSMEKRYVRKNGSIINVIVHTGVTYDTQGKPLHGLAFVEDITERIMADNTLRETHERYSAMIENIGDVIAIVGDDGMTKYQSPNIEKWFGWKPEDLIGTNGWDKMHPDDIERIQIEFSKLLEKETASIVEYRFKCKDGIYKWIELTAVNRINDPAINGVLLNYHDITERKQAELLLRDEKKRLRTILDMVGDPIFVKDNDHLITLANQAFYTMFKMDEKDVIGHTLVEAVPEPERHHFQKVDREVLDTGKADQREEELTIEGLTKTIITRKICYIDESGEKFLVGSIHDISERKLAEDKLKESEEKFRTLIDEIPAGVYLTDADGKCNYVNPIWSKMSGLSLEEAKDDGWKKGIHPEDRDQVFLNWNQMIASNGSWGFEYRMFDGINTIWVDGRAKELKSNGKLVGYLGINTDTTKRKNSENILIDSKNRLEAIFNNTKDYQLLVKPEINNNFRIVAVNKSYVEKANQLGLAINEIDLIGQDFKRTMIRVMFIKEEAAEDILKNYVKVLQTKKQMEFIEDLKVNEQDYYAEISLTPVLDVQGDCKYILYNSHDISEKKNAEKELEKYRIHLEELVKERTKDLEDKNKELERFNDLFVNRELRIKELREQIKTLEKDK